MQFGVMKLARACSQMNFSMECHPLTRSGDDFEIRPVHSPVPQLRGTSYRNGEGKKKKDLINLTNAKTKQKAKISNFLHGILLGLEDVNYACDS